MNDLILEKERNYLNVAIYKSDSLSGKPTEKLKIYPNEKMGRLAIS